MTKRLFLHVKAPFSKEAPLIELPADIPVEKWQVDLVKLLVNPGTDDEEIPFNWQVILPDQSALPPDACLQNTALANGDTIELLAEPTGSQALPVEKRNEEGEIVYWPKIAEPCLLNQEFNTIYVLGTPPVEIGRVGMRRPDIDLSEIDPGLAVSRSHAQILREGDHFMLKPKDTRNGTYLNDQELAPNSMVNLSHGDRVRFGNKGPELVFLTPGSHSASSS